MIVFNLFEVIRFFVKDSINGVFEKWFESSIRFKKYKIFE